MSVTEPENVAFVSPVTEGAAVVSVLNSSGEFDEITVVVSADVAISKNFVPTPLLAVTEDFTGLVIPVMVIVAVVPLVMSQFVGKVTFIEIPDTTATAPPANAVPLVQPTPLKPAVGVTVDAVTAKVPVAEARVVVMVVVDPFPVIDVPGMKLAVHVETAEAVLEPGVRTTAVTLANEGVANSVKPPRMMAVLKAAFIQT
jgi:hypothetical protein